MTQVSKYKLRDDLKLQIEDLFFTSIAKLKTKTEVKNFLQEFLSKNEMIMLSKRIAIGILLSRGTAYRDISRELKVSTSTVTSYALIYKYGKEYKSMINLIENKIKDEKEFLNLAHEIASIGSVGGAKSAGWFATRNEIRKKKNSLL
jgi:uncharacterized protein YerC